MYIYEIWRIIRLFMILVSKRIYSFHSTIPFAISRVLHCYKVRTMSDLRLLQILYGQRNQ